MENVVKEENKKKSLIIGVLVFIIVLLLAVGVYFLFIKKDKSEEPNKPQDNQQVNNVSISVKKTLEVFAFNIILDTNGNAYLDLREDNIDKESDTKIIELFNEAQTYNYNNKSEKLVKLDVQNIKDIQTLDFGNGGGKYITLLDNNDKLYALVDYEVENSGDTTLLTSDELNKVTKVYNDCDEGGCIVYANAIVNGKEEKVSLYDLFETDENETNLTKINRTVELGDDSVQMKLVDGSIYLNDKKVKSGKYSNITVLSMDNFIILQYGDEVIGFINENKEYIDKSYGDITNIHFEDDRESIIGIKSSDDKYNTVEIEYLKTKLNIYETVSRFELNENTNLAVKFNGNSFIKVSNNNLYLNDKLIKEFKVDGEYAPDKIYVMDKYILLVRQGGQCAAGIVVGAINEKGDYINVDTNGHVNIYGIHIENGMVVAKAQISSDDEYCGTEEKIELVYNTSSINMKKR